MTSILKKHFIVSDWFNRIEVVEEKTLKEAVTNFLEAPVARAADPNHSDAFACELTDSLKISVLSKKSAEEQSNALAKHKAVKYFKIIG